MQRVACKPSVATKCLRYAILAWPKLAGRTQQESPRVLWPLPSSWKWQLTTEKSFASRTLTDSRSSPEWRNCKRRLPSSLRFFVGDNRLRRDLRANVLAHCRAAAVGTPKQNESLSRLKLSPLGLKIFDRNNAEPIYICLDCFKWPRIVFFDEYVCKNME